MLKKYRLIQEVKLDLDDDFTKRNLGIADFLEEVRPEKWKPKTGEKYWWITVNGEVDCDTDSIQWCQELNTFNNCFPTREQAELARDKVKELLGELRDE